MRLRTVDIVQAEAMFEALVEAAERGEPTTITREGRPVAMIVSLADVAKIYPEEDFS